MIERPKLIKYLYAAENQSEFVRDVRLSFAAALGLIKTAVKPIGLSETTACRGREEPIVHFVNSSYHYLGKNDLIKISQ